jgi:hypothetical protein
MLNSATGNFSSTTKTSTKARQPVHNCRTSCTITMFHSSSGYCAASYPHSYPKHHATNLPLLHMSDWLDEESERRKFDVLLLGMQAILLLLAADDHSCNDHSKDLCLLQMP